jgi:pimeloyl-ACP methyl ester carboxylesterase
VTRLHTSTLGEQGSPVVFCHGLFGQGKNWTQVAKQLAADHRVLLLDMPNHGRSDWTEGFDYVDAAEVVATAIRAEVDEPVALVGHSMGGKIAMIVALLHPDLVERLCVVDVSPVAYEHHDEFRRYLDGMIGLDLDSLERRADADEALVDAVASPTVRSFLLQNLRREDDGWRWQPNLEVFRDDLSVLGGWPTEKLAGVAPYDGPVLWVGGANSHYITDDYAAAMDELFPRNRRVTVKGAGHWVHSEQPAIFTEVLRRFVDQG